MRKEKLDRLIDQRVFYICYMSGIRIILMGYECNPRKKKDWILLKNND